jgi:hypothetical protein
MDDGSIYMTQRPKNGNTVVPPCPKKFKAEKSSSKVMASVF